MDIQRYVEASTTLKDPTVQAILGESGSAPAEVTPGWVRPSDWWPREDFAAGRYGCRLLLKVYPRAGANFLAITTTTSVGLWSIGYSLNNVDWFFETDIVSGAPSGITFTPEADGSPGVMVSVLIKTNSTSGYPADLDIAVPLVSGKNIAMDVLELHVSMPVAASGVGSVHIGEASSDVARPQSVYVQGLDLLNPSHIANWLPVLHPTEAFESMASLSYKYMQEVVFNEATSGAFRRDIQFFKVASVVAYSGDGDYAGIIGTNQLRLDTFWITGDYAPLAYGNVITTNILLPRLRVLHIGGLPNGQGWGGVGDVLGLCASPCPSLKVLHIGSAPLLGGFANVLNGVNPATLTLELPTDLAYYNQMQFAFDWAAAEGPYDFTYPADPFIPANPTGISEGTLKLVNVSNLRHLVAPWGCVGLGNVISNCPDLETLSFQMSHNPYLEIYDCPKLYALDLDFSNLFSLTMSDANLSASELNRIFALLPLTGGTVVLTRVRGQDTCNVALANARNWNVNLY